MNKKKKTREYYFAITCLLLFILPGCGSKIFPLKGNYTNEHSASLQKGYKDSIWTKLIDFCSQKGLSIKIIDKSSGLLTFQKMEVNWTYEDDSTSTPDNNSAWVVLPKKRQGISIVKPTMVIGEWSVRLQDIPGGQVKILTNLVYVKYTTVYHDRYARYSKENIPQAFSTGILEKLLFDRLI